MALYELSGFHSEEVAKYLTYNHLPNVPVTVRSVDGISGGNTFWDTQTVADIDLLIGTNPALKEVLVYASTEGLLGVLSAVASENKAETLDLPWFVDESYITKSQVKAEAQEFTQLAAQGITVVAAAGDAEAIEDDPGFNHVCDPATQPLVTAVGGTGLSAAYQGPFQSTYISEEVWNTTLSGVDYATGSGVSKYWPIPSWQPAAVVTANGGSAKMRNVPDVAAVASPVTPVAIYYSGGWALVGGTSVSSAVWAGFISIMNSAHEATGLGRIGFFNPILYNMVSLYGQVPTGLDEIVYGNNSDPFPPYTPGYSAGPGYNNCTGWGSMYGTLFAAQLLVTPTQQGTPPGSFGGLSGTSGKTTAKLTWAKSAGATGYLVLVAHGLDPLFFDYVSKAPTVEVTGLIPGLFYNAAVIALNSGGVTNCDTIIYLNPH